MPHLFDLWGESREKIKWRHTLNEYFCKVWLNFKVWFRRYRWKMMFYSIFIHMPHLFDIWGESREKIKWRHTLNEYFCRVWLSFKVWFRRYRWKVMFYSIFIHMPYLFDLWGESREKIKWRHTLNKYSCKVWIRFNKIPELQMKRAKRLILTYILTYLLTY